MASVHTILALATCFDWDIESFDFNGAYLNGTLDDDEELYMHEPPGYESQGEHKVKRLHKSLYGLKQAGRKWYDTLTCALADMGFCTSSADPGVFIAKPDHHILILAIHVDDCILTGSSPELISQYKSKLNDCYALTDLGPIHWLLDIKVTRDRSAHTISLSQTSYIDSILSRFKLSDAKSYSTPMVPGIIHSRTECPSDPAELNRMKKTPYREAIGSLMYASVATRPDIIMLFPPSPVFSTTPAASTGRQQSESFAICLALRTSPSLMERSDTTFLDTLTLTVPRMSIATPFQATHFSLTEALFPGSLVSKKSSPCRLQKLSTLPRRMRPRKPSGFDVSFLSCSPSPLPQLHFSVTTRLQSNLPSKTITMRGQSTLTSASTSFGKLSQTTPSRSSTALQTI